MDLPDDDIGMSLSELLGVGMAQQLLPLNELPDDDSGMHEWQVWGFHNQSDYLKALAMMGKGPSTASSSAPLPAEGLPNAVGQCCGGNCVDTLEVLPEFAHAHKQYLQKSVGSTQQKQDLLAWELMKESVIVSKALIESRIHPSSHADMRTHMHSNIDRYPDDAHEYAQINTNKHKHMQHMHTPTNKHKHPHLHTPMNEHAHVRVCTPCT
jgi:hypothetical protein